MEKLERPVLVGCLSSIETVSSPHKIGKHCQKKEELKPSLGMVKPDAKDCSSDNGLKAMYFTGTTRWTCSLARIVELFFPLGAAAIKPFTCGKTSTHSDRNDLDSNFPSPPTARLVTA
jgi:hypothetical protein